MGQVATFSGGVWTCANAPTTPAVMVGAGLVSDDDAVAVDPAHVPLVDRAQCRDGQVVARSSTAAAGWHCIAPSGRQGERGLQGERGPQGDSGERGAPGTPGAEGAGAGVQSRPATTAECPSGGIVVQAWRDLPPSNGVRDGNEPLVDMLPAACNGATGATGGPGPEGDPLRSRISATAPTAGQCPTGGQILEVWTDTNNNTTYEPGEPLTQIPVCRGAAGVAPARFFVHASVDATGSTTIFPSANVTTPAPLTNGGLVMTELPATSAGAAARVPCVTGSPPAQSQCGVQGEQVGISFVIPSDGVYRVCVSHNFNMGSSTNGNYRTFLVGLYETSEGAASPVSSPNNVHQYSSNNAAGGYRSVPTRHCEVFNWTAALPRKVVRMFYTSDGNSTSDQLRGEIESSTRMIWEAERI